MKLQGVLLDFDGTLGDTTDLIFASWQATLEHYHQKQPSRKEIVSTFGLPLRDGLAAFLPGVPLEEALEVYREHNFKYHDIMIKSFPYVADGLRQLKEQGYKLAVVTSKKHYLAEKGLNILQLRQYMDGVITCEECTEHKPKAEPMAKGAALLNLDPQACLAVGDSPYDLMSGQAAGCRTTWVSWSPYDKETVNKFIIPDYTIDKLTDLVPLLARVNKEAK